MVVVETTLRKWLTDTLLPETCGSMMKAVTQFDDKTRVEINDVFGGEGYLKGGYVPCCCYCWC
jgi:hypothetical protein